jgi:hypothetical protein
MPAVALLARIVEHRPQVDQLRPKLVKEPVI